ncbi:bifunctional tRNA (5-methylaminomethyl-2-thiouridine)(34)-methyltransferase MnmD/FAD-dependent 5-carboxymethylaminomethyl-2-thiouridine(34) oxidoreductase MnmC [Alteromonas sp. 1_MG-2023]|uniref:bifunctional tRNA (5-methylaminomethyl-2-thiouridine)(34)-methyltransferase MnmD/FAD-dependent 5-carboxymethylaminomethyl-2-thiouridine(34) oxidoreductase MnmC n=1 Tax=Alteromonas sp. 1_MG-2023 TaxID=3062669 RepID=UPI0026E31F3D|nr:bifunctional tRNA (5-methylaminomethyl-2-thiouridine)(34)-methyltransferase MnmD/FAD-dependent 5-carboxymethylaminomethyl-2-thiouridine(34) oxidoreductase MnmC [Alteromonas sp. 1_MG-2023]MDO6568721.1 bifunctional tRNA (5-methylaminomethyl-2-thiouridine)(34)-methyltransferase MnmD/FAD-dependent 5-carboxymethylaminomethyl-2-thiouridine(34) oxidoreductase MnmC [Alteromonas sp. 1_MG-2023]
MKSQQASVHFNENGTPVADHFGDVYFSNDSGINETQYVFMGGNDIIERWQAHTQASFVIAETGFGTGLNFLVAMQAFNAFRHANPNHPLKQLFFLSTEKFPLPKADMEKALLAFPALQQEATALSKHYPIALDGCHRRHFDEFSTTLDLWIGDVHDLLPQWHCPTTGLIDAWFLDGFAPSKNPDMWADTLFEQMARLSKVSTTFATFTAAGFVKRGLASAGFTVSKRKGFGRKRDMLVGVYETQSAPSELEKRAFEGPYYRYNQAAITPDSYVVVVGSGLAAATVTLALAKRGINVTICHDQDTLATGASGNPQGGFFPQLHSEASIASRIQAHSFLYASHIYHNLLDEKDDSPETMPETRHPKPSVAYNFCGVAQLNFNEKVAVRQKKLIENGVWPEALIKPIGPEALSKKANIPLPYDGLLIEQGGWISPPDLVHALIEHAKQYATVTLLSNHEYVSHTLETENSEVATEGALDQVNNLAIEFDISKTAENSTKHADAMLKKTLHADHLILATGSGAVGSKAFSALPLRPVRGQVEAIATQTPIDALSTVICHKGYMTPALNNRHALGSTYIKNDLTTEVRAQESEQNLQTHQQAMANTNVVQQLEHDGVARASTRLGSPDHQPVSGMLTNFSALKSQYVGLSLGKPLYTADTLPATPVSTLCCLGSRGLTTAPLMAELLVSTLTHEPLPLNNDLCQAVNPARFMVRDCIRSIFDK